VANLNDYVAYYCTECGKGEIKLKTDPSLEGKKCKQEDCNGRLGPGKSVSKAIEEQNSR
jgi:hypothetical protein